MGGDDQSLIGWAVCASWCGRPELNRHGQSPTDFLTDFGFRRHRSKSMFVVWTIPSPCPHEGFRCCPSSLYTFSRQISVRSLARDCQFKGFPEFEQFCSAGFPARTQALILLKSAASTYSATPAHRRAYIDRRDPRQGAVSFQATKARPRSPCEWRRHWCARQGLSARRLGAISRFARSISDPTRSVC